MKSQNYARDAGGYTEVDNHSSIVAKVPKESGVSPNLFAIESNGAALASSAWDLLEQLRDLRRKLDGSGPIVEPCSASTAPATGVLQRVSDSQQSLYSAQQDIKRELDVLTALIG